MAYRFNCCQPENYPCAREQLRPVPNPEQSSSAVTHMAIADPVAFRQPEPYLSEHGAPRRERKGEEQSHGDSGSPTPLVRRITTPIHTENDGDNENVKQHERQHFGYVAIDSAMRVFWEKSYEGATMADLTEATGLNRSSIHAAFGNKEGLFLKVVERYWEGPLSYIPKALAEPTLPRVVEALIRGSVNFLSIPGNPKGCLSIHGALVCGTNGERVMQNMAEWRKTTESMIKKRIQQAQREGELRGEVNAADYARYIATI